MKLRLAVASILLTSTSVFAADLAPQPAEPAAPVYVPYNWTGFYAGLHAGIVGADVKATDQITAFSHNFNETGFIGGGHAGYNYQFEGGFVIGLEGDIDYTSLSKTVSFSGFDVLGNPATETNRFKNDWQGSIRARAGYAFDRIMPYITGGVAFANANYSVNGFNSFSGGYGGSSNSTRTGWTIGGGIEYALTDNWLLRGEVRYSDFGSKNYNLISTPVKVKFNDVAGTIGVSYKFSSNLF